MAQLEIGPLDVMYMEMRHIGGPFGASEPDSGREDHSASMAPAPARLSMKATMSGRSKRRDRSRERRITPGRGGSGQKLHELSTPFCP